MQLLIAIVKFLFAICMFAFVGAVVGGFAGVILFGFQLVELDHVLLFVEAAVPLFVVWGFSGNGTGGSIETHAVRERKSMRLFGSSNLFDDGPFIEMTLRDGIWHV